MKNNDPYEIASDSRGLPFFSVETTGGVAAYPWHDLKRIVLNADATELTLELPSVSVEITGHGLGVIADLACAARIKRIRAGEASDVRIRTLRIIGEERA